MIRCLTYTMSVTPEHKPPVDVSEAQQVLFPNPLSLREQIGWLEQYADKHRRFKQSSAAKRLEKEVLENDILLFPTERNLRRVVRSARVRILYNNMHLVQYTHELGKDDPYEVNADGIFEKIKIGPNWLETALQGACRCLKEEAQIDIPVGQFVYQGKTEISSCNWSRSDKVENEREEFHFDVMLTDAQHDLIPDEYTVYEGNKVHRYKWVPNVQG